MKALLIFIARSNIRIIESLMRMHRRILRVLAVSFLLWVPVQAQPGGINYSDPARDTTVQVRISDTFTHALTVNLNARESVALYKVLGADWRTVLRTRINNIVKSAIDELRQQQMNADLLIPADTTAAVQRQMRMAARDALWYTIQRTWKKVDVANVPQRP